MKAYSKGFTLVELMFVLAIIALLLTFTMPDFLGLSVRSRLKKAARDVYFNMQRTRLGAVKSGVIWRVKFNPGSKQYSIINPGDDRILDTDDDVLETITLPKSVFFGLGKGLTAIGSDPGADGNTFQSDKVEFNPEGTIKGINGNVYLTIASNETFAVGTISVTGKLKLQKNFGSGWED